jgi:hypothetical protein
MRLRRIGFVISAAFLLRAIVSCCDCPETQENKYTYSGIEVYNLDNSDEYPEVAESGNIPKEAYGIRVVLGLYQISKMSPVSFFPEASAYDCFCPPEVLFTAKDTINSILIKTLFGFDSLHPSNSDVSEYFKVLEGQKYITLDEFINLTTQEYYEKPVEYSFDLFLLKAPAFTGKFKFTVEIGFSNSNELQATTKPIYLE